MRLGGGQDPLTSKKTSWGGLWKYLELSARKQGFNTPPLHNVFLCCHYGNFAEFCQVQLEGFYRMLYITYNESGSPELRGESTAEVIDAFNNMRKLTVAPATAAPITVKQSGPNVRPVDMRGRFNPPPGTSYSDRGHKALSELGQVSTIPEILKQLYKDPSFKPSAKKPSSSLRIALNDPRRFIQHEGYKYGLLEWQSENVDPSRNGYSEKPKEEDFELSHDT